MLVELDLVPAMDLHPVRLDLSAPAVFFFHDKPANSTFSHNKPAKQTGSWPLGRTARTYMSSLWESTRTLLLAMHKLAAGAIHGGGEVAVGEEASTRYCSYLIALHSFGRATASLKTSCSFRVAFSVGLKPYTKALAKVIFPYFSLMVKCKMPNVHSIVVYFDLFIHVIYICVDVRL
jgi:hypothetical protein